MFNVRGSILGLPSILRRRQLLVLVTAPPSGYLLVALDFELRLVQGI